MNKFIINFESMLLKTNVKVTIALPYPNLITPKINKSIVALHCALKSGDHFFDELGIGSYVDKYNVAIIAPDLGNSFFVDNAFENVGFFLKSELLPYLKNTFPIPSDFNDCYCLGISMGAYGAANWALSEDNVFSNVFLISGVYDFLQQRDPRLKNNREQKNLARIVDSLKNILVDRNGSFLAHTDLDVLLQRKTNKDVFFNIFCGSSDYLSLFQSESLYTKLKKNGFNTFYSSEEGGHNNDYWKNAIKLIFESSAFK